MARSEHSFGPDDPPITLSRSVAVQVLNQMEMWSDVVTIRNRADQHLIGLIAILTEELQRD